MSPTLRGRHLLFGDVLDDIGEVASMFPRESVELPYGMPDPRTWTQALELPSERQNRLLGILKAAEARGRVRALRLRYTRMRVGRRERTQSEGTPLARSQGCFSKLDSQAEEITLLIQKQSSARAAIRLELFLPPQLKPTKIPDPLDRQEVRRSPETGGRVPCLATHWPQPLSLQRRRVETILEEEVDGNIFPR